MNTNTIPGATVAERAKAVADWPKPVTTYHLPADWPAEWPTDARLAAEQMATTIASREQYAVDLEAQVLELQDQVANQAANQGYDLQAERDINAGLRAKIAALELGLQTTREAFDELQKDYELTRELASRYMNERDPAIARRDKAIADQARAGIEADLAINRLAEEKFNRVAAEMGMDTKNIQIRHLQQQGERDQAAAAAIIDYLLTTQDSLRDRLAHTRQIARARTREADQILAAVRAISNQYDDED